MWKEVLVRVKIAHVIFVTLVAITTAVLSASGAYWSFREAVALEVGEIRLERERDFTRKTDFTGRMEKLEENQRKILEAIHRIQGSLQIK